jgi:hypothetical protein
MGSDELRAKLTQEIADAEAADERGEENVATGHKLAALVYGYYLDAQLDYEQSLRAEFV